MKVFYQVFFLMLLASTCFFSSAENFPNSKQLVLRNPLDSKMIDFALFELEQSLNKSEISLLQTQTDEANHELSPVLSIELAKQTPNLKAEGFRISVDKNRIELTALDEAGAMYGILELSEQIAIWGMSGIRPVLQNPAMAMRGSKFNIPLDVRTPSYSDASDSAQLNMETMWDLSFWKDYIDTMAKSRYNFVSLWSLHPFPSLVKVPEYPEIGLDDVRKSTHLWKENYHLSGKEFNSPEIVDNFNTIKTITLDEKVRFWKTVMAYAKNRNIDFYIITWNVFVNGTQNKYGITDDMENKTTRDYFRKSVKALLLTYPDLAGIGLTTGENMKGKTVKQKEDWAFAAYGQGVLDAASEMPNRKFTLIHRQHQSDTSYIEERFKPLIDHPNIEFLYSFKYAKAHVMSAVKQPYHQDFVENIGDLQTIWTMRNDSNYLYRWGAPDFVRSFINNVPKDVTRGMYYGSDQWIWGREFTDIPTKESQTQLEVDKHWYHWTMWGRLSYDMNLDNERFKALLGLRFGEVDTTVLFNAWQAASMVYPITTGFHWGWVDYRWYIEGCQSRPRASFNETGFHDINTFYKVGVHKKAPYLSIPKYLKVLQDKGNLAPHLKTPLEVADMLDNTANKALSLLPLVQKEGTTVSTELAKTVTDIRIMAYMGRYYADKIRGSTKIAMYRALNDKVARQEAINDLTEALKDWKEYTQLSAKHHRNPIWLNRVGIVDWERTLKWVAKDIELAKQAKYDPNFFENVKPGPEG